ncbi:MAG: hypothetical protein M3P33_02555 [bacterium]|nr:hypothetical protein [bacterium]
MNRNGIKEGAQTAQNIIEVKNKTEKLNQSIATYSSLIRVEGRARELGFDKVKQVEYIK